MSQRRFDLGDERSASSGRSNLVDVTATLVHATDLAFLIDTGLTRAWVPKSLVEYDGAGTFTMPEPIAKEKGLI